MKIKMMMGGIGIFARASIVAPSGRALMFAISLLFLVFGCHHLFA